MHYSDSNSHFKLVDPEWNLVNIVRNIILLWKDNILISIVENTPLFCKDRLSAKLCPVTYWSKQYSVTSGPASMMNYPTSAPPHQMPFNSLALNQSLPVNFVSMPNSPANSFIGDDRFDSTLRLFIACVNCVKYISVRSSYRLLSESV